LTREEHLAAIKEADNAYYGKDHPLLSDAAYDELRKSYIDQYGSDDLDYTPGEVTTDFVPFHHPVPVTSLAKIKDGETDKLHEWREKLSPVVLEPKYDGLTVVAYPQNDGSYKFVTRGSGTDGEVLPNFISKYEGKGQVLDPKENHVIRGEVMLTKEAFKSVQEEQKKYAEKLSDERDQQKNRFDELSVQVQKQKECVAKQTTKELEQKERRLLKQMSKELNQQKRLVKTLSSQINQFKPFMQIRNAAAGILRSKERSPYIDKLTYICYDCVGWDVEEKRKLDYIRSNTPFEATECSDVLDLDISDDDVWKTAKEIYEAVGAELPLDGIVMKTQKDGALAELGSTAHHPNTGVALKPSKEIYKTTIRDIEFSIGRTKMTPVAIFDPVIIDNTEVTRANIHNKDYFDEMALCKGDTVFVYKSNEIIPQIDSVIHNGGEPFVWPDEDARDEDVLVRDIMHMVSKPVLNITNFSRETAKKLVDAGFLKERNDIFNLTVDEIITLDGLGKSIMEANEKKKAKGKTNLEPPKLAESIVASIGEIKKGTTFPRFMKALCIPGIGAHIGEALERTFKTMEDFLDFLHDDSTPEKQRLEKWKKIKGVGPETIKVLEGEDFANAFHALSQHIQNIEWEYIETPEKTDSEFSEKNFVLTGKMEHPRSYYEDLIKKAGGIVQSSVNSKTNYLVIADVNSTSTKARKARELGTKLISPDQLETMLV